MSLINKTMLTYISDWKMNSLIFPTNKSACHNYSSNYVLDIKFVTSSNAKLNVLTLLGPRISGKHSCSSSTLPFKNNVPLTTTFATNEYRRQDHPSTLTRIS